MSIEPHKIIVICYSQQIFLFVFTLQVIYVIILLLEERRKFMFYITGDTHIPIDIDKLSSDSFTKLSLTRNDYLIICGDFGGIWDNSQTRTDFLYKLNDCNFTTLFVDGNHENFDMLNAMPVSPWKGGKVHYIHDNIIHLMRGQVFDIDGKLFFTMGGGNSIDKHFRIEHESWWSQEMPSRTEYNMAVENLQKHQNKVDYIITHTAPTSIINQAQLKNHYEEELTDFFQRVMSHVSFDKWFFGHFHEDIVIDDKFYLMYNKIYDLQNNCFL